MSEMSTNIDCDNSVVAPEVASSELSYSSLMKLEGEAFIRNLYKVFLCREANDGDVKNFLNELNSHDKDFVLATIGLSKEANIKKRHIVDADLTHLDVNLLLQYDDRDFVLYIFEWVLGRVPSSDELYSHVDLIRNNRITKVDLISSFKELPEGSARRVVLDNMKAALKQNKKSKLVNKIPFMRKLEMANRREAWLKTEINDLNEHASNLDILLTANKEQITDTNKHLEITNRDLTSTSLQLGITNDNLNATRSELAAANERINRLDQEKNQILGTLATIHDDIFFNWMSDEPKLEIMNRELSTHMTIWGDAAKLHISSKASVKTCLFNVNSGDITIGDYTFAGSNVSILAGSHDIYLNDLIRRDESLNSGCDITIGKGVWLASNSVILGPCTIGDNCVIAAGAVVTPGTVIPSNTIYGGIPAKKIGVLDSEDYENKKQNALESALSRSNGVLYKEGWSERRICENIAGNPVGHYLTESLPELVINGSSAKFKYFLLGEDDLQLEINSEIKTLSPGEGSFEIINESEGISLIKIKVNKAISKDLLFVTHI